MNVAPHILVTIAFLPLAACAPPAETPVELRILETTDLHTHIADYDYFQDRQSSTVGLVRTAALIAMARAEASNSILVDNGDLLQGNPMGDYIARERGLQPGDIHPVYKAMNRLDYSVGNIGNHEFNYGLEFLGKSIAGANFPYISANVFHDDDDDDPGNDKPYFNQYIIIDRTLTAVDSSEHDIRIGFIGFVPPQIMQWDLSHLKGNVVAHDIMETALELVPRMKAEGADIVVAIPHSGLGDTQHEVMEENATWSLSKVPGIDAILFGHSHRVFPSDTYADVAGVDISRGTINGVAASMPGFWGSHLGYVDLQLTVSDSGEWRVAGGSGSVRPIYRRDGAELVTLVEPSAEIVAAIKEDHDATIEFVRRGVGEITAPVNSFFALVRDDPSIQIVTSAQQRYVEAYIEGTEYEGLPVLSASAPFKTGGRGGAENYTDIPAGEIAIKHIADLYMYPNTLWAVAVSGAQVREWLEMSAGAFNTIDPAAGVDQELLNPRYASFNFDVIDGVSYEIDVTRPRRYDNDGELINADSHRIVNLRFGGNAIDGDQTFIVATNNYRASGGGSFPGLDGNNVIFSAPDTNRDVLADYIFDLKTIDPSADGNWTFAPVPGDVYVSFPSSPRADAYLPPDSIIEKTGVDEHGVGRYRIRL